MNSKLDAVLYSKYIVDLSDFGILDIDESFTQLLGYTKQDIENRQLKLGDLISPSEKDQYFAMVKDQLEKDNAAYIAHNLIRKDGSLIYVLCYGKNVFHEEYNTVVAEIIFTEITALLQTEKDLEDNRTMLRDVLGSLIGGVGIFEVNGFHFQAKFLSDGFYDVLGFDKAGMNDTAGDFSRLLYGEDILKLHEDVTKCIETGESMIGEYRFIKIDGGFHWMQIRFSLLDKDGTYPRVSAFFMDITDNKQKVLMLKARNEELHIRSEIDSLTGVYNHNAFVEKVNASLLYKMPGTYSALFMIDLDNFKLINDVLGHYEGDRILVQTARHLNDLVGMKGFVGRLGGDEFAVFIEDVKDKGEAVLLAANFRKDLATIKVKTGYSVSVGICVEESYHSVFHKFYVNADQALYVAKRGGKNQYILYDEQELKKVASEQKQNESYFAEEGWVLDDMNDMVFISDSDSGNLLFMNKIMKEYYGYETGDDSYIGINSSAFLQFPPREPAKESVSTDVIEEIWVHEDKRTSRRYIVREQHIRWENQRAKMYILIDVTGVDDIKNALTTRFDTENALRKCIIELVSSTDFKQSNRRSLGILGSYYGAERTCIVIEQEDGLEIHEWHAERVVSFLEENGKANKIFQNVLDEFKAESNNTLIIDSVEKISLTKTSLYRTLTEAKIWSLYSLPLQHEQEVKGNLLIFNPREHLGNLTVLNLLSVFLTNEIYKRTLWERREYALIHDKLTDTYNRARYLRDVAHLQEMKSIGYLVADVDCLKKVNDQFGFEYGNLMVQQIADILKETFSKCRVYRFDGDDFAVLCVDIERDVFLQKVEELKKKFSNHPVGASVGYVWDDFEMDIRKINAHAEELLQLDKTRRTENSKSKKKYSKEYSATYLQQLLENDNFEVYLQPKFDLMSNTLCGAEALIRLNHPTYGFVGPGLFISNMEQAGVIAQLDLWVFEQVCLLLKRWEKEGKTCIPISFNFSRVTLLEPDLVRSVEKIVEKYEIDKKLLVIEITETIGDMENDMISRIANMFHERKFQLSMDDFGTKYSSISILSLMRFDELKLDRSMIHNIEENEISQKVIKHVIAMCKDIGIKCIAEGIETQQQQELLKNLACTHGQGYLFSKPVPIMEFEKKYELKK